MFAGFPTEAMACSPYDPNKPWCYDGIAYESLADAERVLRQDDVTAGNDQDWRVYFTLREQVGNVYYYHLPPRPHLPNPGWRTRLPLDYQNWGWRGPQSPVFATYQEAEGWLAQHAGIPSKRGPAYHPPYNNLVLRGIWGTDPNLHRIYSDTSLNNPPWTFGTTRAEYRYCDDYTEGVAGGRVGPGAHGLYLPDGSVWPSLLTVGVNNCPVGSGWFQIRLAPTVRISQTATSLCVSPYSSNGTECTSDQEEIITYGPPYTLMPPEVRRECPSLTNKSPFDLSNPCNPADGTKTQVEVDLLGSHIGAPDFVRYYRSKGAYKTDENFTTGWRHTYSRRIDEKPEVSPTIAFTVPSDQSSFYATAAEACTSGWPELKDTVWGGDHSTATASFAGGNICRIEEGGTTVAYFRVRTLPGSYPFTATPDIKTVSRPQGYVETFEWDGSSWINHMNPAVSLVQNGANWEYTDANDTVETYNADGRLISITLRNGLTTTITYGTAWHVVGKPTKVTGPFGHYIDLFYEYPSGRFASVDAQAFERTFFRYEGERVVGVDQGMFGTKQYLYEKSALPNHMTGIIDQNGDRFATWDYDDSGRAILSERGSGQQRVEFAYNADGSTTLTMGNGATRTYHFTTRQGSRKLDSLTGDVCGTCGQGSVASRSYDTGGFLEETQDWNGNITQTLQNSRGLVETLVEAKGTAVERTTTTTWHPVWRLPVQRVTPKSTTDYVYDAQSNLESVTVTADGQSRTWAFTYNANGQPLTIDGPRTDVSDVTTIVYNECTSGGKCGQVATSTNALGHLTEHWSYDGQGRVKVKIDPNEVQTIFGRNYLGHITGITRRGRFGSTVSTALHRDNTQKIVRMARSNGEEITYDYDDAHNLRRTTDKLGNYVEYDYDVMGNLTDVDMYDPLDVLRRTLGYSYDINDQLDTMSSGGFLTDIAMDDVGNLTSSVDPRSASTQHVYDALNRLDSTLDALSGTTDYGYDDHDNLTRVTAPNSAETLYVYNGFNQVVEESSPDRGTTTYTYDEAGNLATKTDARGVVTTYTYDALNRLTHESDSTGNTATYVYDVGNSALGLLTSVTDSSGTTTWTYNRDSVVASKTQTIGSVSLRTEYSYDSYGRHTITRLPSANRVFPRYTDDLVTTLEWNSTTLLSNVTYEPFGGASGWTWGDGSTASRSFDLRGLPTAVTIAGQTRSMTHDASGNVASQLDSGLNVTYDYDLLGRLTTFNNASGGPPPASQAFAYDPNANRTSITENGSSFGYTNAALSNRILSAAGPVARSYTYDLAGNVTFDGIHSYDYDGRGRLVSVDAGATATYQYNALGQRVSKTVGGVTTLFAYNESGNLIGEYDASGNEIREHVWFDGAPVAVISGSMIYYVHTDHLGTPRAVTQQGGAAIWRWESDPFGSTAAQEDPDGDLATFTYNLRFPGQYYDDETGLHYNYFRTYDPRTGRYLESDPIGLDGGLNTYAYVNSNPLLLVDPYGLDAALPRALPIAGGAAAADGPIPVGDLVALGIIIGALVYDACTDNEEEECAQEIEDCIEICARARNDFDQRLVWGGSWWRCMTGCVPFRCQDYIDEDLHGEK